MDPGAEQEYGDYVAARAHRLCLFAYLLCGDWHTGEDAVQTALTKLYLAWLRLHTRDSVDSYVRRIIINTLNDGRRLARSSREVLAERPPDAVRSTDPTAMTVDRLVVLNALSRLPARQRAVVILRYWEDQSVEAVAATLNCSTGTVKSQAARGLNTLRDLLGRDIAADLEEVSR